MKKQNKTHPAIKNETEPDFAKSLFTPEWTLNIAVDRLPYLFSSANGLFHIHL